jgi:DNA-binding transcriptional MerR regulator
MSSDHRRDDAGWGYRIGTVAHLTGVHPHTIRAWERRYRAIEPARSEGGTRLYSDRHVARIQLLKAVTDLGHPIGHLARTSDEDLRERLAQRGATLTVDAGADAEIAARLRLAVLDPHLPAQMRANAAGLAQLVAGPSETCLERFLEALRDTGSADVIVLGLEALGAEPLRALDACREASGAPLAVVLYDFAPRRRLAQLARRGARLLRSPLHLADLERAVLDLVAVHRVARATPPAAPLVLDESGPAAERIFDDERLARLREMPSGIACECPGQVASVVSQLAAFERYSRECESRDAADAALHASLARATGQARALMERLLVRICEHDQIRV